MRRIITHNSKQTYDLAKELGASLKSPCVITLRGELGAGKTTFAQGFANGLGIRRKIISPTFIIMRRYDIDNASEEVRRAKIFYHVDLYRLNSEEEVESVGLLDILKDNNSVVVIEWPEKMGSQLPAKRIDIQFRYLNENDRRIIIEDLC